MESEQTIQDDFPVFNRLLEANNKQDQLINKIKFRLRKIATERARLNIESDGVLDEASLDLYTDRLGALDTEESRLQTKLEVLKNQPTPKEISKLADQARNESELQLNALAQRYGVIKDRLRKKRNRYLTLVAEMHELLRLESQCRSRIENANRFLPLKLRQKWSPGIQDNINIRRQTGSIFFDQKDIVAAYQTGRINK